MVVRVKPSPILKLMKSANVSPTVVHKILMIQKKIVTCGTLLSKIFILFWFSGIYNFLSLKWFPTT